VKEGFCVQQGCLVGLEAGPTGPKECLIVIFFTPLVREDLLLSVQDGWVPSIPPWTDEIESR
jgi:hypothetical protein